mmetsp:Transcript_6934/g.10399  ORF Transcript_6934/g.10399 Transcript_6934/m.10399 type:complete len:97 (+) Transcript_6934:181-471(+)
MTSKSNTRIEIFSRDENGMARREAFRAVSQAIGRCIRHSADCRAIILFDSRYVRITQDLGGTIKVDEKFDYRIEECPVLSILSGAIIEQMNRHLQL